MVRSFLVILRDKSQQSLSESLLLQHVNHLKQLQHEGSLTVCGPFVDNSGAVLVLQANSVEEINDLVQADPFIKEKYYLDYTITEFHRADETNQWLMNC